MPVAERRVLLDGFPIFLYVLNTFRHVDGIIIVFTNGVVILVV